MMAERESIGASRAEIRTMRVTGLPVKRKTKITEHIAVTNSL